MRVRSASVALAALFAAGAAHAFGPASDFADAATYADGWFDGEEGGTGFDYPWTFSPTLAPFTIESSTQNGDGDSNGAGDIVLFRCGVANDASGSNVMHFNSIAVPEPGAALAAAVALAIAKRRRA